jgi:peptidyl-prolyl cis-trans isomerase C
MGVTMKRYASTLMSAITLVLVAAAPATPAEQELPVVKGKKVVATVQGEAITLDELTRQVGPPRSSPAPGTTSDGARELTVLNRMINVTLIAQEARRMGLHKLPEIRKMLDAHARLTLREELVDRVVKDAKPDPDLVEQTYRAAVREWKVSAVLFEQEEHAKAMAAELAAGGTFEALAKSSVAAGKATKFEEGVILKRGTADPEVAKAAAGANVGGTTSIVRAKSGPVILKLDEIRYPESPEERAKAEHIALTAKRKDVLTAYDERLRKKYATVNEALLKSLDYEAEAPGIDAHLKDTRAVVEVKAERPITVADLTEELRFQFFHGAKMAAERKRLNTRKQQALDSLVHRKVFRKEALRLGLDRTESYKQKVKAYETSVLFDAALRKVVAPDIKVEDGDVKAYYTMHSAEYVTPEMMRIRSLVFGNLTSAESAIDALQKGADFQWVAGRAEGQVDRNTAGALVFDGRPIMSSELPEGVQKAVAGARSGDFRLYAGPEKRFYVLAVQQVIASTPQPYEQVRSDIAKKVFNQKVEKAIDAYAAKLRELSDVKVYLKAS